MIHTPEKECGLCERLCAFRQLNAQAYPSFYNGAVPSFGSLQASLLVVGLAPGLKGANATGRPFTGDYAGDVLYSSLEKAGLTTGRYAQHKDDGFELVGCRITNAVRCVPPENKPVPPEIKQCNRFLRDEMAAMPNLRVVVTLGGISHKAVLTARGYKSSHVTFAHGAEHQLGALTMLNTYHSSRYNMNTRRLTQEMFDAVIARAAALAATQAAA